MKKRQLIAGFSLIDPETGVVRDSQRTHDYPEKVKLEGHFVKVFNRTNSELTDYKHLGRFIKLAGYIEYGTNRLTRSHAGRKPIVIRQKQMADILQESIRTIYSLVTYLTEKRALFRFDGKYYINPSFAIRSSFISTKHIDKMLSIDFDIGQYINKRDKLVLDRFRQIELAKLG